MHAPIYSFQKWRSSKRYKKVEFPVSHPSAFFTSLTLSLLPALFNSIPMLHDKPLDAAALSLLTISPLLSRPCIEWSSIPLTPHSLALPLLLPSGTLVVACFSLRFLSRYIERCQNYPRPVMTRSPARTRFRIRRSRRTTRYSARRRGVNPNQAARIILLVTDPWTDRILERP